MGRFLTFFGFSGSGESLALDNLSTPAAAAYGMRKLRSSYSGQCLRIRRSSDNAEQDIGFVGSDLDTSSISTFVGVGTAFIVKWYDQSGNANHLTTAASTNQPTYSSLAAVFDGSTDYMAFTSTISQSSGYTIFTNLSLVDTASTKGIVSSQLAGGLYLRASTTEQYVVVRHSQAVLLTSSGSGYTAKSVTRWKASNAGTSIYKDGASVGTSATSAALTQPLSYVGSTSPGPGDPLNGSLQELIIFTGDLGVADSNAVGSSMAAFAGTTWSELFAFSAPETRASRSELLTIMDAVASGLSGSSPFGYLGSSLTRLQRIAGLNEVDRLLGVLE